MVKIVDGLGAYTVLYKIMKLGYNTKTVPLWDYRVVLIFSMLNVNVNDNVNDDDDSNNDDNDDYYEEEEEEEVNDVDGGEEDTDHGINVYELVDLIKKKLSFVGFGFIFSNLLIFLYSKYVHTFFYTGS